MRDLKTLKLWLEGREEAQVNWRLDPKNRAQVSEFVDQYAATPGGRDPSWMNSVLRREREIAARIAQEVVRDQAEREALVAAVRSDYVANGGTEKDFDSRKSAILDAYAIAGRSKDVLRKIEEHKRNQAARTF